MPNYPSLAPTPSGSAYQPATQQPVAAAAPTNTAARTAPAPQPQAQPTQRVAPPIPKIELGSLAPLVALLANRWIAFPLFIFGLTLLGANAIHGMYFTPTRTISVAGIATRKIEPETAILSFSLTVEGTDRASTIAEGERQFNQMLEGLKDYNLVKVDRAPYQITDVGRIGLASGTNRTSRFRYINAARITMNDPARSSDMAAFLYSLGATSVGQPRFIPKDELTVGQELRAEAVKDSRKRVEEMAKASGSRVGKVLSISESGSNSESGTAISAVEDITADANLNTVGDIEVSAGVVVTYELK